MEQSAVRDVDFVSRARARLESWCVCVCVPKMLEPPYHSKNIIIAGWVIDHSLFVGTYRVPPPPPRSTPLGSRGYVHTD